MHFVPMGRERAWDINLNGYPLMVIRDERGRPSWQVTPVPDVSGAGGEVVDTERAHRSWHGGFGHGQLLAPDTYHYGTNLDARFPMQVIMGPLVTAVAQTSKNTTVGVTGFFERGSYLYTLSGRYCNRIDPSSDTVASAGGFPHDFGATAVATMAQEFDGKHYIAFSSATHIVSFDGTSFVADDDSLQGDYLVRFWAGVDWALAQFFLSGSTPSVAWCAQGADPFTAADWTGNAGDYNIGGSDAGATGLAAIERTLFAGKTDGLYYIDGQSGRSPLLVPAVPKHADNGKNMIASSDGRVWYPTKAGLYVFDPRAGTIDDVSPARGLPNRSGIDGTYTAMAHFRSWTFCAVYDGTDSYIMAGRRRESGEPGFGTYTWHGALAKIASAKVTSMHLSSLTSPPRLWFGLSTGNVAYIKLPSNGDNPLLDSNYRYAASGSLYLPADDFGFPGMRWNLSDVIIEAEGLGATTTVQVYERRDLGTWTSLQTIETSGRTVISPTGDKRFNRCELRLDLVNGASTSTPVVRAIVGRATRRPALRDLITTTVYCSERALSRQGLQSRYSAQALLNALKALDDYYPVTLKDWWLGSERSRTVIVHDVKESLAVQPGDQAADQAVQITMRVVA